MGGAPSEGVCLRPLRRLGKAEVLDPETQVQPSEHVDFRATAKGLGGTRAQGCLSVTVSETRADARARAAPGFPSSSEEVRVGDVANTCKRALGGTQTRTAGERTPATGDEVVDHTAMTSRPPPEGPVVRSTA